MSDKRKISIVVLGTEDHLKKSLISLILGKDVFAHRNNWMEIDTYENDTCEVTFTPNFYRASKEIRKLFSSERNIDMCLLVAKDGFSTQEVQQQIAKLNEITGKPQKKFKVVLPLRCTLTESYPFKYYTMEDVFSKLRKKIKRRSAGKTSSLFTCFGFTGSTTDDKRSSKGDRPGTKVNLVLLGMSGTGKSATGNTILGKGKFESKPSSKPVTTKCQAVETEINGTHVRVIDTPDIFDDEIKPSVKNQHVTQCKQLCQSDPCVYLLIIQVGRFTDGERDILTKVEAAFGHRAKEQTIILFTGGEELQHAKMSLEGFFQSCQPELKNIIEQCGRRCVVFENKASRQHQVTKLMQTVNRMLNKQQKQ